MKESVTYQAILEEGRERGLEKGVKKGRVEGRSDEAQRILLRLGTTLFGKPSPKVRRALRQVTDLDVLEALLLRVVEVRTWNELLDELQ